MNRKLMELAERYVAQRKRRMRLFKTVTALALVVAICTSYVLMMPGLTMAAETYCGLEEHTHTADCYVDELTCLISEREATTVFTDIMRCSFEPHHHSSDCYNAQGELSCGYWDGYIHEHDEKCYDSNGVLICTLEEHPMHKHTDACYNWEKQLTCTLTESEGHIHTDACYRAKEPTCGLFESEGHQHTADCVTETRTLICTEDVATNSDMPHVHDDSCYEVTRTYTCGLTEGEGAHHHTDACYPTTEEPTCGLLEGEGAHTHDDSCYEMVRGDLKCKLYPDPAKVHTHSASCVDAKTGYYTCGYIQVLRHQHTNECIVTVTAEDSGHHHTADCYERHYTCGKEEHTHTADCYYDPTPNPDATAAPEVTAEPTAAPEATAEPTAAPEVTAEPTAAPEATAEPTAAPEVTAEPTAVPEATAEPTAVPEATAEPTAAPEVTAEPTAAPEVTAEPTAAPEATAEPTAAPEATAEPTAAPEATAEPTAAPEATSTPTEAPTATPAPTEEPTLAPPVTPAPTENAAETAAPMDEPSPTPALTVIPSMDADAAKPDDMMMPSFGLDPGFLMMANEPPAVSESGMQITNITVSNIILPENANAYNYSFAADFKISDEAILRHGEGNKIIIPAENTHIKTDSTSVWSGTDAKFSNEKPAFKFQYNPETKQVEMWFTDEYIDFVREHPSHDDRTGTMKMSAEIRKDDVKDLGNDDLTIKFGGASTTVKWEDIDRGNNSLLSDLRTWKSGANVNWEKGTIEYTVKIESTKGTNGKNATARDVMTAVNKQMALTNMTVTEVKTHSNWSQVPAVDSASTEIKTDGTCACGTTGTHIHYVYANTTDESGKVYTMTTDYVLPPLSANETYEIKYEYTFDKDGMTGEYDQLTNTFAAQSGGKWDHSQNSSNSNPTDVQIKKLQKSNWYNTNEGCIQWTLTVNENRFNIKDKTLTDTMFDQLVDENGNLLFTKTDGKGYVSQITANNTPITAENYTNYFTVETGADGKPQLKFKDTDAKIVIQYKTPVEATAQNQQITNTAEFDGEQKTSTANVGQDKRYNVVKSVDASMPADPTKNGEYTDGLYPVAWNATYTFPATKDVQYKLNFGDTLDKKVEWKNGTDVMQHYMTAAQAQALLNAIKNLDVVQKHDAQGVPYTITLLTCDSQGKNESTMDVDVSAETPLPADCYYYGFRFETTGEGVVLNDADTDVNATTSVTLPYQTTIYLEASRTSGVDFKNTAVNAGKNGDAWYKAAPNDLVEKKFGNHGVGDLNGQIIHENELYWTILLRNDGVAHDEITLTETLPPHIVVDYIEYGSSRLILSETDSTKMTVAKKKLDNAGTIPDGYEVSSEWSEQCISIKADLTTVGEGAQQQQRINISMKPNENTSGSETILNGKSDMTVKVHCKIADDFLTTAVNGTLVLGVLNNQLDVKYDAALYHKEQNTELTYEEETVEAKNVQKGYSVKGGDQQARITYTIDINQSGAELNTASSTLTLTDTLSYGVVDSCGDWPNKYIYLRDVTLDEGSFRLYEALKDENGNPVLDVDESGNGHLVRGAEIEKYLWKMEFTETEEGTYNYQYPAQGTPSFAGSTAQTRKLNITVTVPDGKALILEYTAQENILLPPEVTNEYNFNDVSHKGINPGLSNSANLEGKGSSSTRLDNSNNDYFSQGGGYIHNNLVIRKVDSANTSLLLPGTEFTLYAWNTATNKFEAVGGENGKVYTDQNGMITYQYNSEKLNERPLDPNVAYMLAETHAIEPYHLVLEDRPLVVFHIVPRADDSADHPARYPEGYNNGNFGMISKDALQALMTASDIKGVVDGPHTVNGSANINIQVKNSKDRRDLYVTKSWEDESAETRPDSVHVMLRRYALTQEQYDAMLAMGAADAPDKTVTMTIESSGETLTKSATFPAGTTIELILNTQWFNWSSYNRLTMNGEVWARSEDGQFHKTITLDKDGTYNLNVAYEEYYDRWVQDSSGTWKQETGWEKKTPNTQGWSIAVTHEPTGMFTPAEWSYIKQYPDTSYEGREGTLTAANGWTTGWQQLESTGATADGHKLYYIYYIVEGKVPYYTTSGITYTIDPTASKTTGTVTAELLNTHRPENLYGEINFDVSKEWYTADGTKHTITEGFTGVQVALYKTRWTYNTEANAWTKANTERIYATTLAEANKWSFKTNALETYTVEKLNGAVVGAYAYTYSLVELNTPSGFDSLMQVSGVPQDPWEYFNNHNISNPKAEYQMNTTVRGTLTLKNVEVENLRIDVVKHWDMADYINVANTDTLTFRLTREVLQDGAWTLDSTFTPVTKTLTITDLADKRIGLGEYPKYTVTGFNESGRPVKAYYRYKVEETQFSGGGVPFRVSYDPADGYVNAETAGTHETVTVTNKPSEISGLYRFNVTKQWYDANMSLAQNASGVASITVKRIKHAYNPETAAWTEDAESTGAQVIRLTGAGTYTQLWQLWNETESVHVEYNQDGTVISAWAYTYEVSEAAIDGYFGTQHLPADFPQKPEDYFTDAALTDIKEIYRQPLTDTLPEVTEKNYYVERFNVKVDKTWARFRDRNELTFCLIQAKKQLTFDRNGNPIKTADQQYTYVTKNWTEGGEEPVWEFNNLPKYYFTVNENGEAQKKPYYYYIVEGYETINGALNPYLYQVSYTGDATLVKKTTGAVNQPADGGTANIHAKNLPGYEVGNLNLNLTKEWVNVTKKPEKVTLNLTETTHSWTKEAGWITYDPNSDTVEIMPDANGNWTTTYPLEAYSVEYNPDGSIHTAHVYTYELTEDPVSGTLPSYTFSANWPKEVGDVLELNSAGEPIKAKDAFKASSSQMEGSFLVTIADASATITNVQTGKLNIVKQWAEEVEYDGAQNPLDIKQVSISLLRNVWGENWTDSDGVVHYNWCHDPFQQNYVLSAENGWKLTIDNLPLYDTTLNPDGSLRKYRYYILENTSVGNDTLDRYTPVMTADESELVGSILYITFKDTTENNVTITNVPKSISIVKQWADADSFGEEGMMQDIYLEVMMKYQELYSTQWKTENLLEKSYFSLKNVICTPSSLTAELVQINGAPYLHVSGLAKADEPWRVTIRNLPGYNSASFIIREVELAGYLNNLPDGKLELGFNEIGTITNTPTQLKITKQFKQAYFPVGSESELPLNVRNTVVYLQIWREKRDGAGLPQHERYTPLLGALEANMDATILPDGTVKLTVGTNTPTDAATLTLTRLPRYWFDKDTGASGEWYYYVKEVDAEGNEVHSASAPTNGERPEINLNVKTLTVTNTLTDVSARKVWTSLDNQFTLNPANLPDITLTLKQTTAETAADGDKIIATVTLGWDAEAGKVVTKNLDGWQFGEVVEYTAPEGSKNIWWGYKWYNLPAYDAGGNIYRYYVVEKTPVGSGWQLVTDDTNATNTAPIPANSENRVFQITNTPITYTLPETGGIGTLPYTLGGLLLMAAAALLLGQEIKRRREGC